MADNENGQPASSRRMEILQQSLAKKQAAFDKRLQTILTTFLVQTDNRSTTSATDRQH